ncbi:MAG: hypothetical protein VW405_22290 [Rhodospirillaceae bacterium]
MLKIVEALNSLVTRYPSLAAPLAEFAAIVEEVVDPADMALAEARVLEATDALACAGLTEALGAHASDAAVVEVDGLRYRRLRDPSPGTYFGLRGPVTVKRHLYRQVGVRNGPTIVPLELSAGLVDGLWTPLAAAAAGHLVQSEPSRDAVQTCRALHVMPYSRSSLERAGDLLGERWESIRCEAEDELMRGFIVPEEATTLSVSVDRVSLPMEEAALDERGAVVVDADGKEQVRVAHRMAYCGVWTLHDAEGAPLHSVRYGRMPAEGHGPIEESLWGDIEALTLAKPTLRLIGLADGAPEMQHLLDRTVGVFDGAEVAIDFWHVVEKVADAVKATGRNTVQWLPRFRDWLLTKEPGAEHVLLVLRTWEAQGQGPTPEALSDAITYLDRNAHRMRYKRLRDRGLPIGSGHVEATCKTLVSTRMKRSGARWKPPGGQAILSLRSLAKSSRWDDAMAIMLPTWRGEIRAAA